MSSSEQAPEPTMDEILASIRKIIADDDEGAASASETSQDTAAAGQPGLANDIASAMSHDAPATDTPAENEDDIFDLTNKVPEAPQPPADPFPHAQPAAQAEAYAPPASPAPEMPPAAPVAPPLSTEPPAAQAEPDPAGFAGYGRDVLSGAPMEESALPESMAGFGADEPPAPAGTAWQTEQDDFQAADAPVADETDTSEITDLDSFAPGQDIAAGSNDMVDAAYAESDVVAATGLSQADADVPMADNAMDAPADEFSATAAAAGSDVDFAPSAGEAPDTVIVPPAPEEPEVAGTEAEAAPEMAAGSPMTLEDSVKEMLKPMLREWLDDNMPRIVESAVKDELHNKHNQF